MHPCTAGGGAAANNDDCAAPPLSVRRPHLVGSADAAYALLERLLPVRWAVEREHRDKTRCTDDIVHADQSSHDE